MPQFKKIDIGRVLYEALRGFFSVNTSGNLSLLFKYCFACVFPIQAEFDQYEAKREINYLVAQCRFQMGQMKNLLNYLFDPINNSITIDQSVIAVVSDPMVQYPAVLFDSVFGEAVQVYEIKIGDRADASEVVFNIPSSVVLSEITAVIEQIKIQGLPYTINII